MEPSPKLVTMTDESTVATPDDDERGDEYNGLYLVDRAAVLADLAENTKDLRPRLFAIYGITPPLLSMIPERRHIGWGMDFGEEWGAVFWDPIGRDMHKAESAEQVLKVHQIGSEGHLVWLDEE